MMIIGYDSNSRRESYRGNDRRGFAAMDEHRRQQIGHKGGETVRNEYGPEHYEDVGRKGGRNSHRGDYQDDYDDSRRNRPSHSSDRY